MNHYSTLLTTLQQEVKKRRFRKLEEWCFAFAGQCPSKKLLVAIQTLRDLEFELLEQPYSPSDLVPSGYHVFPQLEKSFKML